MPTDIFLSYAREDRARVQPIAEALTRRGYDVWWDKGLRSGEDYRDRIEELLKTSRCVVVAWSASSLQSDFVMDEAGRALRRQVLLPVFLDGGIEPPLGFGGIHTSDLSGWLENPDDPAFEQFATDVDGVLRQKRAPAAPALGRAARVRAAGGGKWPHWRKVIGGVVLAPVALVSLAVCFIVIQIAAEVMAADPAAASVATASLGGPTAREPVAALVAAEPVLEGEFRLVLPPGQTVDFGGSPLVTSLLELHDAAAAADGGTGIWVERLTTLAGADTIITPQSGQFRIQGNTLDLTLEGDSASKRFRYAWRANGELILIDESGQHWTWTRQ